MADGRGFMRSCAVLLVVAASSHAAAQSWELAWADEFEGDALDLGSWSYQTGTGTSYGLPEGWGNNELQYYTNFSSNVSVSGGTLKIVARRQNFGGEEYTSGRIRTMGLRDFTYGRFEARMKLPSTTGIWPAFWMLPTDSPYGGWASSGEIDIMESVNIATTIYGTIHHGAPWPNNAHNGDTFSNGTDFSQDFHEYAIEWEPDEIRWFIDGVEFHSVTSDDWYSSVAPGNNRAPFDVPFHLLLNIAVGGNFPGNPNGSSQFPQTLEVDYVRVYEGAQAPFGGSAHAVPGVVQCEDFDEGSNGQSYNDCDPQNQGGAYRGTGVDIEASTPTGYNIGWMCQGEWLEYTVDVESAGVYDLEVRVASQATGGSFRIEVDGQDRSGTIAVPVTGGWQTWTTTAGTVQLDGGEQVIRFVNLGSAGQGYNLDSLAFSATETPPCSAADLAEPYGQLDFFDVSAFLSAFAANDLLADMNGDGTLDFFDISAYLGVFSAGCP